VDVMFEMPLKIVIENLSLAAELRCALRGNPGPLRDCLDLVLAYEKADWDTCNRLREKCRVSLSSLAECYFGALKWTESLLR
jgi:EAL and modified HD-GYP domain-containing signal transduction protein